MRWRYDLDAQTVRPVPSPADGGTDDPDDRCSEPEAWAAMLVRLEDQEAHERTRFETARARFVRASVAYTWAKVRATRRMRDGFKREG